MSVAMSNKPKRIDHMREVSDQNGPPVSQMVAPIPTAPARAVDPPTHAEDPILSASEVARQLGKVPQTILNWIKDGLLTAVRQPGGRLCVRKSEVNKFLGGSALNQRVK
jgi:excisionase family DNA binding protein